MLALESVPERLPTPSSGVFDLETNAGDFRPDPVEELETKDAAEDIASCRAMDQTFLAAPDTE